jgi:hypothetical protein
MRNVEINRRKPGAAKAPTEDLTPPPDPPAEHYTHRMILNVFGKRFELTSHVEVRAVTKGPAMMIEMPRRRAIDQ